MATQRTSVEQRQQPNIFFVIPCYNEIEQLPITAPVLQKKISALKSSHLIAEDSRVLFVDDGSKDGTWQYIRQLNKTDASLFHGVKLAHNRGHQNALLAGLMTALSQGCDAAISLDADLQDDINVFDEFVKQYVSGAEIVYGVRSSRNKDTWFKRNTAEAFYALNAWMGAETIRDHADYRLMGPASAFRIRGGQSVPSRHRTRAGLFNRGGHLRAGRTRSRRKQIPFEEDDQLRG